MTIWFFFPLWRCEFHSPTVSFLGYVIAEGEIKMDLEKVWAVSDWPTPSSREEVQRFLGFANFYRKFIRNFSSVAALLHELTLPKKGFLWTSQVDNFQASEELFHICTCSFPSWSSTSIRRGMDASDSRVGAVLSQRNPKDDHLHPCTFLSRKLSSTERNYDIGNRESLAVKVAVEEWRHWLEGTKEPYIVWKYHKYLEHLRTAKRLNSSLLGFVFQFV